jgi:hypothetical protein
MKEGRSLCNLPGLTGGSRLGVRYICRLAKKVFPQSSSTYLNFTMSALPELNRQDSDTSQWTDAEKNDVKHLDQSRVPQTITEEDEGGNVGLAAYERSKELGEIVSF